MRGDDGSNLGEHLGRSPGRPKGSLNKTTRHRALVLQAMDEESELTIWRKITDLAADGDIAAARLCMEYAYGKPRQVHEIDTAGGLQEIKFVVAPVSHESETTDDGNTTTTERE